MASKLLNVLQRIENERQTLITGANLAGYNIPQDSSFIGVLSAIKRIETPADIPDISIPSGMLDEDDWVRPTEWPDTKNILDNTEQSGTNTYPYLLVLFKSDSDSLVIPKSQGLANNSSDLTCVGWSKVLTSDGTLYTTPSSDITHTWDKSKDIIIPNGAYEGHYRYIIYYTSNNSNASGTTRQIAFEDAVEIIGMTPKGTYPYPLSFPGMFKNTDKLLNIEYYDSETNLSYVPNIYVYNSNPYINGFESVQNLRSLKVSSLNKGFCFANGNYSSATMFRKCYKLQTIDLDGAYSEIFGSSIYTFDFTNCYNLRSAKLPEMRLTNSVQESYVPNINFGYNPKLRLCKCILGGTYREDSHIRVIYPSGSYGYMHSYVPTNCVFEGRFSGTYLPANWNGHSYYGNVAMSPTTYRASLYTGALITATNIKREVFDLSLIQSYLLTNTSYSVYTNSNSYVPIFDNSSLGGYNMLREYKGLIVLPVDTVIRFDLSHSDISRESFLSFVQNLKDISNDTVYYPNIKVHKLTLKKLTQEDLEALSNKGWTVTA